MLKQRVLTALVLIPLTLFILLYLPQGIFLTFITLFALIAAWEWTHLSRIKSKLARIIYLIIMLGCFAISIYIPIFSLLLFSMLWWIVAGLLLILYAQGIKGWCRQQWLLSLIGIVIMVPCWAVINKFLSDGLYDLIYLLLLVWSADSVAYFAGKRFGKYKLVPTISPGKTIEGTLAALIVTVPIALLASLFCQVELSIWKWGVLLSVLTVFFSIIGDLFESMLKREANLKDSGTIFPGHGGVLDRIDSLLAATPVYMFGAGLLKIYLTG